MTLELEMMFIQISLKNTKDVLATWGSATSSKHNIDI